MRHGAFAGRAFCSIWIIVALFVLLAGLYSVVTPVMEASDELWHYPMVKYIADHRSLPFQDPAVETAWRQEGSQAPLYYALGTLLTFWIDTSNLPQVRYANPHGDNGIITEDGNINLMIHGPADGFPWRGAALAIHLIRFMSVLFGAGTVYFTYRLALDVGLMHGLALAAAAITAFNPMFCFINGSVNNDTLAMFLCAVGIWQLVRLTQQHGRADGAAGGHLSAAWRRDVTLLGLVLGLAVLTKSNAMGLLPLTALAVSFVAWRRRSWPHFWSGGLITAGLVLALSGWWFVRNAVLYDGDWTGIERFIVILGYRDPPATLRQLWGERQGFMMAFWGLFGGVNVPLPGWIYDLLSGAVLCGGVGLIVLAVRRWWDARRHGRRWGWSMPLTLLLLWPAMVVLLWAAWALRTWSSQGRLVFGAMSAWSVWLALGLSGWLPDRARAGLPGALGVFLFGVAAWAPWGVITPAYRPPILPPDAAPQPQHVLQADVGGQLRLLGYDVENLTARPGEAFRLTLYWEAQQPMDRDWSIFCHVFDVDLGLPVATRDRFPGQGLLSTRHMPAGLRWADRYVVYLPQTAYAPARAVWEVGLYDRLTGERPPILIEAGEGVEVVENGLRFQPLRIEPRPGDMPNSTWINLEDKLALIGWEIDRRVAGPGESLTLTLHWECLQAMSASYTVSAQVLAADRSKVAQWDSWPGDLDTRTWQPGQRVIDRRRLTLSADAPPGGYDLVLMLYDGQTLKRMRLIHPDGRVLPEDFHRLGVLRVTAVGATLPRQ